MTKFYSVVKLVSLFLVLLGVTMLYAAPPVSLMQLGELTPTDSAPNDWFGFSIAISGNTVAVGDFDANIEQYGAVYVYLKSSSGWMNMTQVAKLTSSDNGQGFGTSVSISGNTIVVGAANTSNFDAPASTPGAVYVFVKPTGGWADMTESAKLSASDGQPGDALGNSVSISGNTIAAGAFFAQDSSGNDFAGRGYVFVRPAGGWSGNLHETAKLTASDSQLLNYMGQSIAISGNTVVAGSIGHNNFQGTAYVFVAPVGGWVSMTQTAELTASDGKSSSDFGFSTAMSGNTVVVGSVGGKGAGYVFVKPSGGWVNMTQTAELRAANATTGDSLGQSAAISGNAIVIGAPAATVGSNVGQGAAYVFTKPASGWKNTTKALELTASDGVGNDAFALSVGISGTTVVTGAIRGTVPGVAYVFGP